MWTKCLIIVATLEFCFGQSLIPIYDVRLDNLLRMQHGSGWPQHLNVVKGNEALMRLTGSMLNLQNCHVTTPTGLQFDIHNPPNDRYERWGEGCGLRVKRVEESDHGRWRLVAVRADESITGWTEVNVAEDTPSYNPEDTISLPDGGTHAEVELTTLENSYCLVTQPFSDSSLVPGHCRVTLDRTTRAVQGRWNVVLGIPGRVSELQIQRNVAVQTEQLVSGYREDTARLHLYCNILHTQKNITFCRFQRNSETAGFNVRDGLSDGRYSYFGEGFAERQCGMTIETPTAEDYGVWRCTVGLQEWSGTTIVPSTPMQALFKASARQLSAVVPKTARTDDDIRTLYVQNDSTLTISCKAESSLAYCWFHHPNGSVYSPVERQEAEDSEFWYDGEGLQIGDCVITFPHVTEDVSGEWTCHMGPSNYLGIEETDRVNVRVTGPLAANRKEIDVTIGEEATLYCHTASGPRPIDYCRFLTPDFVGISIDSSVTAENPILDRFYFTPERNLDYGDCSLTIRVVGEEDIGQWTCAALLHDGVVESMDTMIVFTSNPPHQPLSVAGIIGIVLGCISLSILIAGVIWYKKGKPIPWQRMSGLSTNTDRLTIQISPSETPRSSNNSNESYDDDVIPRPVNIVGH